MAFDITKLQELLALAGKYGPTVFAAIQELVRLLASTPKFASGPHDDDEPCSEHCCELIDDAVKKQIEVLATLLHLKQHVEDCEHCES